MVSPTHLSSRPLSRRCPLAAGATRAAFMRSIPLELEESMRMDSENTGQVFCKSMPQGQFSDNYNASFASYLLAIPPAIIAFLLAQRWAISGLTQGAVK